MISLSAVVAVVIYLAVAGLIFWLLWWLVNYIAPPEPFRKVANVILAIVGVLVVCSILLSLVGGPSLIVRP
jgi:DMSO reductase anchor subunit